MDSSNLYMNYFFSAINKEENGERWGRRYIIYSAGIGDQINFELDLLNKLDSKNVELYAFDPTPKSLHFLSEQKLPDNFHIMPYAISNKDEKLHFALPKSEGWVSGSCANVKNDERNLDFNNMIEVDARAVSSIMKELQHKKIDLLKLDIEGSEFDVLEDILNSDIDVMQMCIDFHDHMLKQGKKRLGKIMSLLKKEYVIFDVERKSHHICCIRKDINAQLGD